MFAARTMGSARSVVKYDATGNGVCTSATTSSSYNITVAESSFVIVAVSTFYNDNGNLIAPKPSALTCDSVAMKSVSDDTPYLYWLSGVSSGTKTIDLTFTNSTAHTSNAVSYTGVNSIGAKQINSGSGTVGSITPTGLQPGGIMFAALRTGAGTPTFSGGTLRYSNAVSGNPSRASLGMSDSATAVTFSETTGLARTWHAIALILYG